MCSVVSKLKVLLFVTVTILNSVLEKQHWLQSAVSGCVVGCDQNRVVS